MPNSEASPDDLIGKEIGPYRLVRRLGVGGMAEAYEAIRRGPSGFSQRVCMKLVLPFLRNDRDFVRLFEREARLVAQLRHRNIVGVIDFGEIGGRPYMALELVDGADLRVLLDHQRRKRLALDSVVLVGLEIADALAHAHGALLRGSDPDSPSSPGGIVHRDISPSNVLVSRQGEVMLSDFGVAKAMEGASHRQSSVKGKVPYMSPEQLRAEPLDGRADLFALGVVLFEALAGQRPYDGAHDPAIIMQILNGDRPPLRTLVPELPAELCDTIDSLISPNRDDRPESAAHLIELLDPYAPSALERRTLGRLAADSRAAADRLAAEVSEVSVSEVFGDADTALEDTGVKPAGSTPREEPSNRVVAAPPSRPLPSSPPTTPTRNSIEDLPRRRSARGLVAVLLVGLVALVAWSMSRNGETLGDEAPIGTGAESAGSQNPEPDVRSGEPASGVGEASNERALGRAFPENSAAEVGPSGEPSTTDTREASGDDTEESAPAAATPGSREADARAKPRGTTTPPRVREKPAVLSVVVFPWGDVWIDGERVGKAPVLEKALKPGRYVIGAGEKRPTQQRTVRVRAGQRRKVTFDLTPEP
ncbi:MAG: protein kinase [Myxococcota bacterium]